MTKTIKELLESLHTKIDKLNKYYARSVTVINTQMEKIEENNKKIDDLWDKFCKKDNAIELTTKKK